MESLVHDIRASHDARAKALGDVRKDTRQILNDAKSILKDFAKESAERAGGVKKTARDVKEFLKSSEESRKHDFDATMKTVEASLEDVRKDSRHARQAGKTIVQDAKALLVNIANDNKEQAKELREYLKKAEYNRKTDFKGMMNEIQEDLKDIKHDVSNVTKDAKDMVSRYHSSRATAQKHWASLSIPVETKKSTKHREAEHSKSEDEE